LGLARAEVAAALQAGRPVVGATAAAVPGFPPVVPLPFIPAAPPPFISVASLSVDSLPLASVTAASSTMLVVVVDPAKNIAPSLRCS
ncbi:unnamed protein product, partial [Closterium sp. NIES-54]